MRWLRVLRPPRERVLSCAGGVPFFVVSCAQALHLGDGGPGQADVVPWDVGQSVRQRVAALSGEAQEVLGMAAVVGRVARYSVLTRLAAGHEQDLPAALDAACRLRLLEEVADEHAYRFTHDLIREVVEADLGLARRTLLHGRIAAALEGGAGEPVAEEVAYHYIHTQEHARAAHWLERVGDRAMAVYSTETALAHYSAARERLAAAGGEPLALAGLDEKPGTVLRTLGRYDEALAALDEAAARYRSAQELEGLRRTLALIGGVYVENGISYVGPAPEGLALLLLQLDAVEATEATPGLAALYEAVADLCWGDKQRRSWQPRFGLRTWRGSNWRRRWPSLGGWAPAWRSNGPRSCWPHSVNRQESDARANAAPDR